MSANSAAPAAPNRRPSQGPTTEDMDTFRRALPVADPAQVRAHTKVVLARHRGELALVLLLHALAAVAALASPWLIVDDRGGVGAGQPLAECVRAAEGGRKCDREDCEANGCSVHSRCSVQAFATS